MIMIFPLSPLDKRKSKEYKVGYSFDLNKNDFYIEFYTKELVRIYDSISMYLMSSFKSLHDNLHEFCFFKECDNCSRYTYSSNKFNLDLKSCSMSSDRELFILHEYFGLVELNDKDMDRELRIYKLHNYYDENRSRLSCFDSDYEIDANYSIYASYEKWMDLPTIQFTDYKKMLDRLNKLMVFS